MRRISCVALAVTSAALLAWGSVSAANGPPALKIPAGLDRRVGFQAWAGGDPKKPLVTDAVKGCFECHVPQKANDYTFSTYLR